MAQTVELKDLVGAHSLDGVDFYSTQHEYNDDSTNIRFRLDGKVYVAMEDANDGYRSCMEKLVREDNGIPIAMTFAPHQVDASLDSSTPETENDILVFTDTMTGRVVLRVGTDHGYDYYPCFVAEWTPENLHLNAGQ